MSAAEKPFERSEPRICESEAVQMAACGQAHTARPGRVTLHQLVVPQFATRWLIETDCRHNRCDPTVSGERRRAVCVLGDRGSVPFVWRCRALIGPRWPCCHTPVTATNPHLSHHPSSPWRATQTGLSSCPSPSGSHFPTSDRTSLLPVPSHSPSHILEQTANAHPSYFSLFARRRWAPLMWQAAIFHPL
jgi:hypothetical protein